MCICHTAVPSCVFRTFSKLSITVMLYLPLSASAATHDQQGPHLPATINKKQVLIRPTLNAVRSHSATSRHTNSHYNNKLQGDYNYFNAVINTWTASLPTAARDRIALMT